MTIKERNKLIDDALVEYKVCHDKYFPIGKALTDPEWEEFISHLNAIADKYKDTNISMLSDKLLIAFLDDVEFVHKKWIEKAKN